MSGFTLVKLHHVIERTGLSKASIYRLMRTGLFPRSIKLSERCSRWRSDELIDWLEQKSAGRDWTAQAGAT